MITKHSLDTINEAGKLFGKVPLRNPHRWEFSGHHHYAQQIKGSVYFIRHDSRNPKLPFDVQPTHWNKTSESKFVRHPKRRVEYSGKHLSVDPKATIPPTFYERNGRKRGLRQNGAPSCVSRGL